MFSPSVANALGCVGTTMKPGLAHTEISRQIYMSLLAGHYYWTKARGDSLDRYYFGYRPR